MLVIKEEENWKWEEFMTVNFRKRRNTRCSCGTQIVASSLVSLGYRLLISCLQFPTSPLDAAKYYTPWL